MALVYLGLGTNLGDREANLRRALAELKHLGIVKSISSLYETEPVGYPNQGWFLNIACALATNLEPVALLHALKAIEGLLGRRPTMRHGPRIIDLDILLYDDRILDTAELTIPHPQMHRRRFVLQPLAEIAPEAIHPGIGQTIQALLRALPEGAAVQMVPGTTDWWRCGQRSILLC